MKTRFCCKGAADLTQGARILRFVRSSVARGRILGILAASERSPSGVAPQNPR
jgi:hypothetical protein